MIKRSVLICVVAAGFSVLPMFGGAIAIDGAYHEFFFGTAGTGTEFAGSCGGTCTATTNPVAEQTSTSPWTFSGAANVFILDLAHVADRFELFDTLNGGSELSKGLTSNPANTGTDPVPCGFNIGCAAGNALYSQGTFALGAGNHSIRIRVVQNALNTTQGNAVFSVSAPPSGVPEPATLSLLGAGLLGLSLLRRRKVN